MGQEQHIETRMMEAQQRWGIILKRKNAKEACGPCPFCSLADEDGFLVWTNGGYFCRQCSAKGWLDENDPRTKPLTPEQKVELRLRRLERQQREQEQRLNRLEQMHQCQDHLRYHANLTGQLREYWWDEGIYDAAIDKYLLGYCDRCPTFQESSSYTIPIINGGQLENIRHRLALPNGKGKYRPHMAGLGISLFNADALETARERIVIVEGEKKAIVLDQAGFAAVGITGKRAFKREWLERFGHVAEVVVALDPDATESAYRLAALFDGRARVAALPCKIDDMITQHRASAADIESYLRLAREVKAC